jgi:RNA polymerase sigma-70 factor (ECF subfamily)
MPTDLADLVALAQQGDGKAFEQLVRVTTADVYTLAYRLTGNEEDARDVTQETFLRAYKGLERFRGDAQFSTWLYRITANCAASHMGRSRKHRHEAIEELDRIPDARPDIDPEMSADAALLRGRVTEALEELPAILRAVIVLRDVYDMPHDAIAEELGITEAAAKVRLHRARRKLRERLFPMRGEVEAHAV